MTTPTNRPVDIEALVRDVFSRVAVAAYSHGINLSVHIDHRLPARALGDGEAVGAYLRQALRRMIEAGRTNKIALAFWRPSGSEEARIELEACRALDDGGPFPARLADLWALPLGSTRASVRPHRQDADAETVMIQLPLVPAQDAPPLAGKRRALFQGRYILHLRNVLIDTGRLRDSMAALGLETDITTAPDEALSLARARVGAGKPVDMVVMDARALGPAATELARVFRADPRLAPVILMLVETRDRSDLPSDQMHLFDAVPSAGLPWRPLLDVIQEQLEKRESAAGQRMSAAESGGADIPSLAGKRILVAEDVSTNQVLLRAILEPTGASIETVSGGDEVLAQHMRTPADLILMDLQLAGMGGIAATRRIRALEGKTGAVPIIALTAYARNADRDRAMGAGMDAYLSKPVVIPDFYELVRRLLDSDQSAR